MYLALLDYFLKNLMVRLKMCLKWCECSGLILIILFCEVAIEEVGGNVNKPKCISYSVTKPTLVIADCDGQTHIPKDLPGNITALNLGRGKHNSVERLQKEEFKLNNLTGLIHISLQHCKIKHIDIKAFYGLVVLKHLDLSFNNLTYIYPRMLELNVNLETLTLSENRNLSRLLGEFPKLTSLRILEMNNCNLSIIPDRMFHKLENLKVLHLRGNQLKSMKGTLVKPSHTLDYLDLRSNPWNCDCNLRALVKLNSLQLKDPRGNFQPTCFEPPNLGNRRWDSIIDFRWMYCLPKKATLKIHGTPLDLPDDTVVNNKAGSDFHLECEVWADPPVLIQWLKNGEPVMNLQSKFEKWNVYVTNHFDFGSNKSRSSILSILDGQTSNDGIYVCQGRNIGGETRKGLHLQFSLSSASGSTFSSSSWFWIFFFGITGVSGLLLRRRWLRKKQEKLQNSSSTSKDEVTAMNITENHSSSPDADEIKRKQSDLEDWEISLKTLFGSDGQEDDEITKEIVNAEIISNQNTTNMSNNEETEIIEDMMGHDNISIDEECINIPSEMNGEISSNDVERLQDVFVLVEVDQDQEKVNEEIDQQQPELNNEEEIIEMQPIVEGNVEEVDFVSTPASNTNNSTVFEEIILQTEVESKVEEDGLLDAPIEDSSIRIEIAPALMPNVPTSRLNIEEDQESDIVDV